MSLELAAKHLAAQGRGPDSHLVHMSPREVAGLQALAMASGGSLSINPNTGLPEAGFLDKMLPMLIGAGITAATGGAAAPWMIGLGIGGVEAARTGNIGKGLTAGLGAYGGAGLGAGLLGAGAESVGATAGALGTPAATGAGSQAAMLAAQNQGFGQAGLEALSQSAAVAPGAAGASVSPLQSMATGAENLASPEGRTAFMSQVGGGKDLLKYGAAAAAPLLTATQQPLNVPKGGPNPYRYTYDPGRVEDPNAGYTGAATGERRYFNPRYVAYAGGGPVEAMSNANAIGANTGYPMANIQRGAYATPYQQPISQNVLTGAQDARVDPYTGEEKFAGGGIMSRMADYIKAHPELAEQQAQQDGQTASPYGVDTPYAQFAGGGISNLGDYSDGGRLLKGPGDGVSDSIPAVIGGKQPARLADGEFVVPARIVSELGNGSTDAGARKLYAMMDRIQSARGATTGKGKVARNTKAEKYLPA